jgi:hypothetical protein
LINYDYNKKVRSISVTPCEEPPEKWVKLKSKFEYELSIDFSMDQQALPSVDNEIAAELKHITPNESDVTADDDDDD